MGLCCQWRRGRPSLIGFVSNSPEASELLKVHGDLFFFFTLYYCFMVNFSTAGWTVPSVTWNGSWGSGRSGSTLSTLHNFCFGTVPNTAGDKPLGPSDQLPFTIFNHTLLLYLDLVWIVSLQSKMFNHLGSGFNYFFSSKLEMLLVYS